MLNYDFLDYQCDALGSQYMDEPLDIFAATRILSPANSYVMFNLSLSEE